MTYQLSLYLKKKSLFNQAIREIWMSIPKIQELLNRPFFLKFNIDPLENERYELGQLREIFLKRVAIHDENSSIYF